LHPRDGGQNRRDTGFQGFGATTTTSDGFYRFRTIKPVPYGGRTPHIHFKVKTANRELTTQMYVAAIRTTSAIFSIAISAVPRSW